MIYSDPMYGQVELPDFIEELSQTPEVQRLKGISQDSLPAQYLPWKVPSRFEHSMGVCCLSCAVVGNNNLPKRDAMLLQIASLLHDAGNPGLSHLPEVFLQKLTGKDGESFLANRLAHSEAGAVVKRLGFDIEEVVLMVTGKLPPLSVVLNGSMDLDNLDNVGRYWYVANPGQFPFNAQLIASELRYQDGWSLAGHGAWTEATKWQRTRQAVYAMIYGQPHLNAAMMGYRAIDIAFERGEITEGFFHLNDMEAFHFLDKCNGDTRRLIYRIVTQQWHHEIVSIETTVPSQKIIELAQQWNMRGVVANALCKQCKLPKRAVCVYFGKGKDKRLIDLPFSGGDGLSQFDQGDQSPIYRVRVYIDPNFESKREEVRLAIKNMIF